MEIAENYLDMPGVDLNMTYVTILRLFFVFVRIYHVDNLFYKMFKKFSENLLMCAIRNNQEKMAEFLIKKGIDVNFEAELVVSENQIKRLK